MIKQVKLKDVASHSKGKQINGDDLIENGTYDYLNGGINPSGKWNEYNTESDTVTISEGGNSSGYVNFMIDPFWCGAHCYYLYDLKTNPKYLYYALKSQEKRLMRLRTGAAMPNIKKSTLSEFTFQIDDNSNNQNQIVRILDNVSNTILKKNQQLSEYDQLIKSRFVEMFESFKKTDLSNIAEIIMGQSPDSAYYNENGVGLPFFQGKADFGAKYTNVSYWTTKPSKTAKKGNVLMSVRAPVGPVNISSIDCCIGRGLCSINAIPNKTNNEFLYNALIAIQDQITAMGTGSTFKAINKSDVYAIQLPLAPISLQNEFAIFVEQIDKLKFEDEFLY